LQVCVIANDGQAAPPLAEGVIILRVLVCMPPPQRVEHSLQLDQPLTWQSTGHACVLHDCCITSSGHAVPPLAAATNTDRVADCMPPPQVAEQPDQPDHADTTQLVGHGCMLHACVCSNAGQAAPPLAEEVMMLRVLDEMPPPHDAVHGVQVRLHALTTQSTGHGCVLHACVSCNDVGHAAPPLAACCVMVRLCVCTPPPHVAEHALHALHSDTPQSTGQACVLQACVWDKDGHATPPFADERMTVRVLVWEPPPQRVEHADHAVHSLTWQSTGHG